MTPAHGKIKTQPSVFLISVNQITSFAFDEATASAFIADCHRQGWPTIKLGRDLHVFVGDM